MTPHVEEWRPVIGYEDCYEVSNLGGVRSIDRIVSHPNGVQQPRRGVLLKPARHKQGYLTVLLHQGGRGRTRMVHILVAEAFIGPRPKNADVCHYDDDKSNNAVENLRYGTRSENVHDSVRNGTHPGARKTHCLRGHEFTQQNTSIASRGDGTTYRRCKACMRLAAQRRKTSRE